MRHTKTIQIGVSVMVALVMGFASTTFASPEQAKNLIRNASFENLAADGMPRHWSTNTWGGKPLFEVETSFGRSGKRCVKISSVEGADASWTFPAEVRPNTDYRLSAWIKTDGLDKNTGLGALVNLHQLQMEGKTGAVFGTAKWTRVESEFNSGTHSELLFNLLLGGWGHSTGAAWFDDVELVELNEPPPELSEAERTRLFASDVFPILEKNCFSCHGPESKLRGDLFLGSRDGLLHGGESGPALNLTHPRDSFILQAVNYETFKMPPKGKISKEDIATLTRWVQLDAPWAPDLESERPATAPKKQTPQVTEETRAFWSFRKVERPRPPATRQTHWVENPVDAFILARIEEAGLTPAPRATAAELIRRATYDLTGLPPSPQDVESFVADESPGAYEELIERLLASPHYGERWGRHWLDLVRYAESNSFERDGPKPFVWRYRDYVIRAFNSDKPFDQFIIEQLAGDEIPEPTRETIIATGYYRLGQWDDEPADPKQALFDEFDDILTTTSQALLGLTVNCARCHDHKLDPISQRDYYRMVSFFRNVRHYGVRGHGSVIAASVRDISTEVDKVKQAAVIDAHKVEMAAVTESLKVIERLVEHDFNGVEKEEFRHENRRVELVKKRAPKIIDKQTAGEYERLTKQRNQMRRFKPAGLAQALAVKEHGAMVPPTHVLIRGNPNVPGDEVTPGFPSVLSPPEPEIETPAHGESSGRRLALAKWIASPENPLTSRVLANRLWQHHFGRGIVSSPNNFGLKGDAPTHPSLINWLAAEIIARGWSIKDMHRLIMTSASYRMATTHAPSASADPDNKLFARFGMRRLTAEEVRDSILAVNGRFNGKMFGPSIYPLIPREVLEGQSRPGENWGRSSAEERARRSIYIHVKRSLITPILEVFDYADSDFTCPVRFQSVQPTQALTMLNSVFINDQAKVFAKYLRERESDLAGQVRLALSRVTQRSPSPGEVERGVRFVEELKSEEGLEEERALATFCLLALNLNEFMFVN